jgi:hypothetical protein
MKSTLDPKTLLKIATIFERYKRDNSENNILDALQADVDFRDSIYMFIKENFDDDWITFFGAVHSFLASNLLLPDVPEDPSEESLQEEDSSSDFTDFLNAYDD